jgi:hypothetical protein
MKEIDLVNPREIEIAAMRLGKSLFDYFCKKHEVAVKSHNLSKKRLILDFPDFAGVSRAAGDNGDGTSDGEIPRMEITREMLLLFIDRAGIVCSEEFWAAVVRESLQGKTAELPRDALTGLATVQAEVDKITPVEPKKISTPVQSTGQKEIKAWLVNQPNPKPARKKPAMKKAAA